jgi:hypothetical protein
MKFLTLALLSFQSLAFQLESRGFQQIEARKEETTSDIDEGDAVVFYNSSVPLKEVL